MAQVVGMVNVQVKEANACPLRVKHHRAATLTPFLFHLCAAVDGRRKGSRKKTAEERRIAKQLSNRRQYEKLKKQLGTKKKGLKAKEEVKNEEGGRQISRPQTPSGRRPEDTSRAHTRSMPLGGSDTDEDHPLPPGLWTGPMGGGNLSDSDNDLTPPPQPLVAQPGPGCEICARRAAGIFSESSDMKQTCSPPGGSQDAASTLSRKRA